MWKSVTAAINRFMQKSYDEAAVDSPAAKSTPPSAAKPPATHDDLQHAFQQAVLLLQAGSKQPAEATIHAAIERIAAEQPEGPLLADALFKEATILGAVGEWPRAEEAARKALQIPAPTDALRKERLTYQLLLADILSRQAKPDEAERLLREGLAERKQLFGETHANYALGLSALGETLLAGGRAADALPIMDEALRILSPAKHERLPVELALRAYIVKAVNNDAPILDEWPSLSRGMRKTLAQDCVKRATAAEPKVALAVLREVRQRLDADADRDAPLLIGVNVAIVNAARATGDHDARIDACRRMVELCEPMPDAAQLAMAKLALAMSLADAGRGDEAASAYEAAAAAARPTGQLGLIANVMRNYAAWADGAGLSDQADALFREAVENGASSGEWSTHGQCTVAYGLFLRRHGRIDDARRLLEEAVAHLPPNHPDLPTARDMLRELDGGEPIST